MFLHTYYLIRSKQDGQYLVARPKPVARSADQQPDPGFLLMFQESYEALSYLNAHARDVAEHFTTESLSSTQLKTLVQRWGFTGVGVVKDPLVPTIEFFTL